MNVRGRRSARQPMTIHHPIRSRIESLAASQAEDHRAQLIFVLQDAVESGASVGFLPPLSTSDASAYWDGVAETVRGGSRVLLVRAHRTAGASWAPRSSRSGCGPTACTGRK